MNGKKNASMNVFARKKTNRENERMNDIYIEEEKEIK